ncbi:disease resistance protein RGA2-like [Carex rostrata]
MADLLLSSLIPIVMRKSADPLVKRMGEMWGIDDQRKKLHRKLLAVQDVLTDAEEQGDAKPSVKSWLAELKSAAYDADNVLDEFCYEELRRDAVARGHNLCFGKVSGFFSVENPVLFRYKMSRELKKVVGRIDELVTEMERFKFVLGRQGRVLQHVETHSYVIESEIVGREDDKEKLVTLLTQVCPSENLMVLPVVGMGGLGKTTLAQLVYNDPRVKDHFKLLVWVCVSEEFDVGALTKLIIDTIVQKDCKVPRTMELLQKRLREEIHSKRYLLVLDDVWNENGDKWEQLKNLLNCGDSGSVVFVTTRSGIVADVMGTIPKYNLGYFNEEDSWKLFHRRAFGMRVGECEELVEIGKKLVKNCQGLPLAIKTLGSLMSYKNEVGQWLAVLEQSMIWENKHANVDGGVLSVLRLSYDHLPSYMKQCFAFCAIFPKDYVMEKEKLVQYWLAHGFIPSDGSGGLEMSGSDIFNELALRSFFQNVEKVCCDPCSGFYLQTTYISMGHRFSSSQTTCKMHDLMHDLAQSVMRDECLSIVGPLQMKNTPKCNVRHILLGNPMEINVAIKCFPTTRSLILSTRREFYDVEDVGYVKFNFLRILDMCRNPIENMTTLRTMMHLRYLELSVWNLTTISETISTLYLLQTLSLYDCTSLSKLPEGMRYMKSLRHFYMNYCFELKCMPPSLGELQYLQTLTYYVVGTGVQNRIGELKNLNLGGGLRIYNLREIQDARDAREANMVSKQNLEHLELCWGLPSNARPVFRGSEAVILDLEVLDALKPCNKLKTLQIDAYRGCNFPVWMTEYQMLENLVKLCIIDCKSCTSVPPLYMLPLLQTLYIAYMDNLRHLCCGVFMSAKGGEDAPITFPSLKSLILEDMSNLDCWCEGDVSEKTSLIFPVLTELLITHCPKLTAIPIAPLLEKMTIEENQTLSCSVSRLTTIRMLTLESRGGRENNADKTLSFKPWVSLENLTIKGFNHIIPPTDGREGAELSVDVNATALREVSISDGNFFCSSIPSNSPLWLWKCFRFIENLYISNCDSLTFWPEEELSNLIYLQRISIFRCRNFIGSLSEPLVEMSTRQVLLPKLQHFSINSCPKVVEVPKLPSSLESLNMSRCVKLESLPEWLCSLVGLKELIISSFQSLNSLPSSIGCLIALESLYIEDCFNLESLPEGMQGLESLKTLILTECPKIRILPEGLLQRLRSVRIRGCPLLQKHGKYWHLISEIPDLYIEEGGRSSKIGDLTRLIPSCSIPCSSVRS